MENYCSHTLESRLKKDSECYNITCLMLYIIYLIENNEGCKKIDGGTF